MAPEDVADIPVRRPGASSAANVCYTRDSQNNTAPNVTVNKWDGRKAEIADRKTAKELLTELS